MSAAPVSPATGPRTLAGKSISSLNAIKHGLRATKLILPGESQEEFESLRNDLIAEYQPANTTESLLVDQFAIDTWRLMRARRVEVRIMEASSDLNLDDLNKLGRYQTSIERAYHRTLNTLQKILAGRRKQGGGEPCLAHYDSAHQEAFEGYMNAPSAEPPRFVRQNLDGDGSSGAELCPSASDCIPIAA